MCWECYCKSQNCGQFHLVHYIGLTPRTTFVQPDGGITYVHVAETSTDTFGAELAPIAGHAPPPTWEPWF